MSNANDKATATKTDAKRMAAEVDAAIKEDTDAEFLALSHALHTARLLTRKLIARGVDVGIDLPTVTRISEACETAYCKG